MNYRQLVFTAFLLSFAFASNLSAQERLTAEDCCSRERQRIRTFREAQLWLFESEGEGIFSFNTVCALLRLTPGYIRRGLRSYEREHWRHAKYALAAAPAKSARNLYRMAS